MTYTVDPHFSLFDLVEKLNMRNLFTNNRRSLIKISREIEDGVLENAVQARIFAGFQKMSFFLSHVSRYTRLAAVAERILVFGVPDVPLPDIPNVEYVRLSVTDALLHEWFLVVEADNYFSALTAKDRSGFAVPAERRMFDGIWTFDSRLINHLQTQLSLELNMEPVLYTADEYDYDSQIARVTNDLISDLEKRNQELERQQRLRQDLAHMLVHDLRNPLAVVNGYLELIDRAMRMDKSPEEVHELVDKAQLGVSELGQLIDNILDLNRLVAGEFPLNMEPVSPLELFEELIQQYTVIAQQRRLAINMDLEDPSLMIYADRQATKRVFTNLLGNAFRHTAQGSITLEASLCDDDRVRLGVIDTGEGIPAEDMEHVFDQYYQSQTKTSRRGSSGLGLAFCKRAVEAQQGEIRVESTAGEGSAFYFTLPQPHAVTREAT